MGVQPTGCMQPTEIVLCNLMATFANYVYATKNNTIIQAVRWKHIAFSHEQPMNQSSVMVVALCQIQLGASGRDSN